MLTIGIGHNVESNPLSNAVIEQICSDDIDIAIKELDRSWSHWKKDLADPRQNVLIEMVFNLGYPRFSTFQKMIKAITVKDYDKAATEMLSSKWAVQVGRRANHLADQMRLGKYFNI